MIYVKRHLVVCCYVIMSSVSHVFGRIPIGGTRTPVTVGVRVGFYHDCYFLSGGPHDESQ